MHTRIWRHLEDHWDRTSLQHLANIPSVLLDDLYKQMITSNRPVNPFLSTDKTTEDAASIWTLCSQVEIYVMAIGLLKLAGLGIFCCHFFRC